MHQQGKGAFALLYRAALRSNKSARLESLRTKNKKLDRLSSFQNKKDDFSVPIINLTDKTIDQSILYYLRFGLNHSFVDKNRYIKLNLAIDMEFLFTQVKDTIPSQEQENFKHYLRTMTNRFTNNVYHTTDYTYKILQKLASDSDLVVLSGDKDSSVVILPKEKYVEKMETLIYEGIQEGKYAPTTDTTISVLTSFQNFLQRNFRTTLPLDKIKPSSNQPAFLYGTAKTHKFDHLEEITSDNLKLRPIVSTIGTFYYETAKFLAEYLQPLTENEYVIKDTTHFPSRLINRTLEDNEIPVSYDVTSLFTQVPLDETIDFIIEEIYTKHKLPPIGSKLLFKRLLNNVTKKSSFTFNGQLYKQVDGCGMGNPLSPVLANIFMAKLEADVVAPHQTAFYDRYVDDCFSKKVKDKPDELLEKLNKYHPNITFTAEENPDHFLDTSFKYHAQNQKFESRVYQKPGKFPTHWKSQIPIKWKRNCITGALHRAYRISTNFDAEVDKIKTQFLSAGYPCTFINNTISHFKNNLQTEDPLIPPYLFREERKKVFIRLPYCFLNEKQSKKFIAKLNSLTDNKYFFIIVWQTKQIRHLFRLKDKNIYSSHVVYQGNCSCGETYVGETSRNTAIRIAEHENIRHNSEPAKHLKQYPSHCFTWTKLHVEHFICKRLIAEGLLIRQKNPTLNKQVKCYQCNLFPLGIT